MRQLIIIPTLNSPKIPRFARDFGELDPEQRYAIIIKLQTSNVIIVQSHLCFIQTIINYD